jgi:hypothetical protein
MRALPVLVVLTACGGTQHPAGGDDGSGPDAGVVATADRSPRCADITDQVTTSLIAPGAGDFVLSLTGNSASPTSWGETDNEAVVLEVSGHSGLIGHLILHQGKTPFGYAMHVGALSASETLTIKVSSLSAAHAIRGATVCDAALAPADEAAAHAPEYRWPVQKSFDDVPLLIGWSRTDRSYQTVMTDENGGTAEQCGGGALGMQSEIARWGRSMDIESHYRYGGAAPVWERCTGRVAVNTVSIRTDGTHPILYYGDGHNRVFENRGGYGEVCGTDTPEKADGDLDGWNVNNQSNDLAHDDGRVIILRPVPVDLDAIGYKTFPGRREGLPDTYAPWMYRVASLELAREDKIDNNLTFGMSRYLYVDVRVSDVGGTGDSYCSVAVSGGFRLRAVTTAGITISSPQITGDYAGNGAHDWKRVAIVLPPGVAAADIDHFVFDAYDNDGIYLTAIGDAFIPVADGPNGAHLAYVRRGTRPLTYYVDDGASGCTNGTNTSGPGGIAYQCIGGQVTIAK